MEATNIAKEKLVNVVVQTNGVALIELCRPKKLNALSTALIEALLVAFAKVDKDDTVRAIVLTGTKGGSFSAGADLTSLVSLSTSEAHKTGFLKDLAEGFAGLRKPLIATVTGYALGGGFEMAMACDIIYASKNAVFGLPEISIGTMPGLGGTQRLGRALGKFKAMEMILTSSTMTGEELHQRGLVSAVFEADEVLSGALACAEKIASFSTPVVQLAKQSILNVENMDLATGLLQERTLYYSTFSLQDKTEGISAFLDKRKPVFKHC